MRSRRERRLGIVGHHRVEPADHGLARRGAQVGQQPLEHRAVGAGDAAPVALDRLGVGRRVQRLEEGPDLLLGRLRPVADRIRHDEMGDPCRPGGRVLQGDAGAEAVPHQREPLQLHRVHHGVHVGHLGRRSGTVRRRETPSGHALADPFRSPAASCARAPAAPPTARCAQRANAGTRPPARCRHRPRRACPRDPRYAGSSGGPVPLARRGDIALGGAHVGSARASVFVRLAPILCLAPQSSSDRVDPGRLVPCASSSSTPHPSWA